MLKKSDITRNKIISKSAKLFYYNGYKNTSLNMILSDCEIAKGNFYYYFKSKDELLISVIKYHKENMINAFQELIEDVSYNSIKSFFNIYFEEMKNNKYYGGSPIGNLILELADLDEEIRNHLKDAQLQIVNRVTIYIKLLKNIDIDEAYNITNILFNAFEGTIAREKLEKSGENIKSFFYLFDKILMEI